MQEFKPSSRGAKSKSPTKQKSVQKVGVGKGAARDASPYLAPNLEANLDDQKKQASKKVKRSAKKAGRSSTTPNNAGLRLKLTSNWKRESRFEGCVATKAMDTHVKWAQDLLVRLFSQLS